MPVPEQGLPHTISWKRIATVAAVLCAAIALIWIPISRVAETRLESDAPTVQSSPLAPVNGAPTGAPTSEPGNATPDTPGKPVWRHGSFPDLLAMVPDQVSDGSLPLNDVAIFADFANWSLGQGEATPAAWKGDLPQWEMDLAMLPASLRELGLDPIWRLTYGFDMTQVDQVLVLGQAPDYIMVFTGDFGAESLQSAWVTSGYQAIEVQGVTVWSLFPGDRIDLSAPESRPAMGTMNNVVLLPDGTLVAAARMSRLGSVIDVANGNARSLAEQGDVAAILAADPTIESLVTAVLSEGTLVQGTTVTMPHPSIPAPDEIGLGGTPVPEDIAEVGLVLMGLKRPADSASPVSIWLSFDGDSQAFAASHVIQDRLSGAVSPVTGGFYRVRFQVERIDVSGRVVTIDLALTSGLADWPNVVGTHDLGFVFWLPDD